MSVLSETGRSQAALNLCLYVVGFLCAVLGSVTPLHPLLGLQLFTLGRERYCDRDKYSIDKYSADRDIV